MVNLRLLGRIQLSANRESLRLSIPWFVPTKRGDRVTRVQNIRAGGDEQFEPAVDGHEEGRAEAPTGQRRLLNALRPVTT